MDTSVEFHSTLFRPFLPEDAQVNPGVYGAELAFWLAERLAAIGVATSYPNNEDWGWFLEYATQAGGEYWLHCRNITGEKTQWHCYLVPKSKSLFGRGKANLANAEPLLNAVRLILEESPEITDIRWSNKGTGD